MDIKDLNKSQLILLALLISFVTSIATGIATVSLMEQAPDPVTQTINRIVQRTVETVLPGKPSNQAAALSAEEAKLLLQVKTLGATIISRAEGREDKILGDGLFFGGDRVIVSPALPAVKEKEIYVVKGIFGEKEVKKIISEKDYSVLELKEDAPPPAEIPPSEPEIPVDASSTPVEASASST